MGNCAPKPRNRSTAAGASVKPAPATVRLYGSESCQIACRIRVALLYKPAAFHFVPTEGTILIRCGSDTASGSAESLLQYLDSRLGGPPASMEKIRGSAAVAAAIALQHRSMERHLERMARRAGDLAAEGGSAVEARRMGRWYGQLVEVMLEHARMEERLLFPALERADSDDPGVCKVAKEEHGRDLPIMNGIKEDIKSLVAMEAVSPFYQEALLSLFFRFKTLQEHCKEHFKAEERELLPLLEAAERSGREEAEVTPWSSGRWAEQVMEAMEGTHSHLFPFFMTGLLPDEAMRYVDLVCGLIPDQHRVVKMLRSLIVKGKPPAPGACNNSLRSL